MERPKRLINPHFDPDVTNGRVLTSDGREAIRILCLKCNTVLYSKSFTPRPGHAFQCTACGNIFLHKPGGSQ
jgi:hypothetical protein